MIYLIFGEDTFRSKLKLKEIIEKYKKRYSTALNVRFFDFNENSFDDFDLDFKASQLFFEKKLFVLKGITDNLEFQKKILKEIEKYEKSPHLLIFFVEGNVSKNTFFEELKKRGQFQEFKPLNEVALETWAINEFKKYGVFVERGVVEKLISLIGNDLWRFSEEIKKLVCFCEKRTIKKSDVDSLVKERLELNVFKTIEAISFKDKKLAFKLLNLQIKNGEKEETLFALIKYQFRNLIQIKDLILRGDTIYQLKMKLNLHPFILNKLVKIASKFQLDELKKIYNKILNVDVAIKTGRIAPDLALDFFLINL